MDNGSVLQYLCGNCQNILKEINFELDVSFSIELCPFCGIILSENIQKRSLNISLKSPTTVFQRASKLPKLTFDIQKLDEKLHFLTLENKVCLSGIHTQKLIERLCVRVQLPSRYGGLNSKVLLIDGANSSDVYQCVDFAQQYGLDVNKTLDGIISSRSFTVYQLANTIIHELPNTIKQYNVKVVIITNLLYYFTNDPYLDSIEMKSILKEIIKTLSNIQNCMVVVSLSFSTQYDYLFSKLFSRIIDIKKNYGSLSVHITDNGKKTSTFLKEDELETTSQH